MRSKNAGYPLRTSAHIDLDALEGNYREVAKAVGPDTVLLCVIKADAYGHGAVEVGRRLQSIGAQYFGVATIDEGRELREKGISSPILVLSGIMPWEDAEPLIEYDLTAVVANSGMLDRIEALNHTLRFRVHVKVDTGMGRLGFDGKEVENLAIRLAGMKHVEVEGAMSHFASSERRDDYAFKQIEDFHQVLATLRKYGIEPKYAHMANSGAICNLPEAHFNMVRPGIVLYGSYPDPVVRGRLNLKPVMNWFSRIAFLRSVPSGASLSCGRTYVTDRARTVAYVPIGYADGYRTALSNRGTVLVRGRRCAVVGRVCMEWVLVDVTDLPSLGPGEEVVLLGSDAGQTVSADEMAQASDTIPYEILCGISKRVPRLYG
jgi:alanine racemase